MTTTSISPPSTLSATLLQLAKRRIVATLFIVSSLSSAAVINVFTVTPILAVTLAADNRAAGLPSTFTHIGRALMAYPIGWLFDRVGRRAGLTVSYLLGTVGATISMIAVITGNLTGFLFGAMLFGMMRSGSEQSRFVAAEVVPFSQRSRVISFIVFAGTISSILGPQLTAPAIQLAQQWTLPAYAGPFLVAIFYFVLGGVLLFTFLRPDPLQIGRHITDSETVNEDTALPKEGRSIRQIYRGPLIWTAVLSMVVGQVVMALLMVITPVHMRHHYYTLDEVTLAANISWVIMAHTLGMFGLSMVTGWLIDRFGALKVITVGGVLLIASAVFMPLSTAVWWLALSLFLVGLGWNFCFVAGSALLSAQLNAVERGRAQGVNELMVALGAGSGSLLSGVLFDIRGIETVSGVGITLSFILLGMVAWAHLQPIVQSPLRDE